MTEACLKQAGKSFLLGKLDQCTSLLNSLPLIEVQKSVVLEWVQENNLTICKDNSDERSSASISQLRSGIKSVLQKIRGLPSSIKLASLEVTLTYNHAVLALGKAEDGPVDIKERTFLLEKELLLCLQRWRATQGDMEWQSELDIEEQLTAITREPLESDTVIPMTLLCCLASIYYLMDGNIERALHLLEIPSELQADSKQVKQSGISLLMKLPNQNLTLRLENDEPGVSFQASSLVRLLKACCFFHNGNITSFLKLLQTKNIDLPAHMLPICEYMKGYCLFQEGSYNEAAQGLHSLSTSFNILCDSAIKARCNNLIGCCLAKQGRPNSAIQKFREALQQDFSYLEPLYNLSLVYRQLGLCDAELESLNLLVTAVENTETDPDDCVSVASAVGPVIQLSDKATESRHTQNGNISLIQALYALCKRCLELQRYNVAAEKYLDLLAVLEDSNILIQKHVRREPDGTIVLPNAEVIYLEAALALCSASKSEDAILLCDQILSKCSPPDASTLTSPGDQMDVASTRFTEMHSTKSQDSAVVNTREPLAGISASNNKTPGTSDCKSSEISKMTRKRQRDERTEESQMSCDIVNKEISLTQTELGHLHLYCSALLLKSQCSRMTKQFSKVTKLLDKVLDLLKGVAVDVDFMKDLSNVGCPSDSDAAKSTQCGPQLKKRRMDTEESDHHCEQISSKTEPIRKSLLKIKAQACNDKAMVLIGQGKLQDAMKFLLKSVQYQPDNPDVLYNYTLLLLKMGRKQDAVVSFNRLRTVEGTSDRIQKLEKAVDIK